jgi:hypothetical protein
VNLAEGEEEENKKMEMMKWEMGKKRAKKNKKKTSYWGNLAPRINVENACIQQIRFYVFLFIHAVFRHVILDVWAHYYSRTIENTEERK